jgi:hypothetical protein
MVAKVGEVIFAISKYLVQGLSIFVQKKSEESLKNLKTCRVTNLGLEFFYFCQTF